MRNASRAKTVSDAAGEVRIEVPRDREGTFEPQIVKKRQPRLTEVDEIVLSLYAKGLTTGESSAHFAEIYGASISKETISRITDKVVAEMTEWATRPLDGAGSRQAEFTGGITAFCVMARSPGWRWCFGCRSGGSGATTSAVRR